MLCGAKSPAGTTKTFRHSRGRKMASGEEQARSVLAEFWKCFESPGFPQGIAGFKVVGPCVVRQVVEPFSHRSSNPHVVLKEWRLSLKRLIYMGCELGLWTGGLKECVCVCV